MDKIVPDQSIQSTNPDFWDELYNNQITRWDLGQVSPPLEAFINQWEDKTARILIPGGGYSHEAKYLVNQQFQSICILDLAPSLIRQLRIQFAGNENVKVVEGNFFSHQGVYDLILEQTFFCACDPSLRESYADKMYELLAPGGHLAGVLFDREFELPGPPFGGSLQEYITLFKDKFDIHKLEPCYNSFVSRQGTELFFHLIKKQTATGLPETIS